MCNRIFMMNNVCIHFNESACNVYTIRHNTGLGKVGGTGKEQMSKDVMMKKKQEYNRKRK